MRLYHAYEISNETSELSLRTYEAGLAPTGLRDLDVVHDADDRQGMWHSQSGQDHTVASILGTAPTGRARFFVDLAANSPVVFSNTRALERDLGWSGICIEGNPHLIAALVGRRRCSVVCTLVDSSVRSVTFDIASQQPPRQRRLLHQARRVESLTRPPLFPPDGSDSAARPHPLRPTRTARHRLPFARCRGL